MIFELEKLYVLRADLMLVLITDSIWTFLDVRRGLRLIDLFGYICSLGWVFGCIMRSRASFVIGVWTRPHYFILFLQAWFIYFFMFKLVLKGNYIIERSESVGRDILLTCLSELKVALFPEIYLLLCLFKLIMGGLEIVQEHSSFSDECVYDLFESNWVFFIEVLIEQLLFFHG